MSKINQIIVNGSAYQIEDKENKYYKNSTQQVTEATEDTYKILNNQGLTLAEFKSNGEFTLTDGENDILKYNKKTVTIGNPNATVKIQGNSQPIYVDSDGNEKPIAGKKVKHYTILGKCIPLRPFYGNVYCTNKIKITRKDMIYFGYSTITSEDLGLPPNLPFYKCFSTGKHEVASLSLSDFYNTTAYFINIPDAKPNTLFHVKNYLDNPNRHVTIDYLEKVNTDKMLEISSKNLELDDIVYDTNVKNAICVKKSCRYIYNNNLYAYNRSNITNFRNFLKMILPNKRYKIYYKTVVTHSDNDSMNKLRYFKYYYKWVRAKNTNVLEHCFSAYNVRGVDIVIFKKYKDRFYKFIEYQGMRIDRRDM